MNYTWTPATGQDVPDIVKMAQSHFQTEIDTIFVPEPITYSRNVTLAVVNQFYIPTSTVLAVCRDSGGSLMAYTWAKSGETATWSDDKMTVVVMAHVALDLSARVRIRLIEDMMILWERFAGLAQTPILCSTTMRHDQTGFLKLHARAGYSVRGSYAYKRVNTV